MFRMVIAALSASGVDPEPLLRECRISRELVDNALGRLPIEKERAFWRRAADETRDPALAVTLSRHVPFGTFPVVEYLGASCQTVFQALEIFTRFVGVAYGGWNPSLEEAPRGLEFRLGAEGDPEDCRHSTEFGLAVLVDRLRRYAAAPLPLTAVHFRHRAPSGVAPDRGAWCADVRFEEADDLLVFDPAVRELACVNASPMLVTSLLKIAEALFGSASPAAPTADASPLVQSVLRKIEERIARGDTDADGVAEALAMSRRTLQRHLTAEGRSLRQLVAQVRRRMAEELLARPELTVEDVALTLGYSTLSAFNRAFKEWSALTPAAYRKSLAR